MELKINKQIFLNNFLIPINKIADKGILSVTTDKISCISCSSYDKKEQTIILYTECKAENEVPSNTPIQLNLPNFKKLINAVNFIRNDTFNLKLDNNSISYSNKEDDISFRYHLLENGILENPTVKMENVYAMGFDFESIVSRDSIQRILKGSVFSDQSNKIYLYTKEKELFCALTDNNIQNTDSINFSLSKNTNDCEIKNLIAMNLEIFRVLSSLDFDTLVIKINQSKGIIMFELKRENYLLQYIVTSLLK